MCTQVGSKQSESQQGSQQSLDDHVCHTTCRVRGTFLSWEAGNTAAGTSQRRSLSEGDFPRADPMGTRSRSWATPGEVDQSGSHSGNSGSTDKQDSECASPPAMFGATPQPSPVLQHQEASKQPSLPLLDLNSATEPMRNFSTPPPKAMQFDEYDLDFEVNRAHSGRSSPRSHTATHCSTPPSKSSCRPAHVVGQTPPSNSSGGDTGGSPDVNANDATVGETGIPVFSALDINAPTVFAQGATGFESTTHKEAETQVQQMNPAGFCLPTVYNSEQPAAWHLQQDATSPSRQLSPSHQPMLFAADGTMLVPATYAAPLASGPLASLMSPGLCLTPACAYTQCMPGYVPDFPIGCIHPSQPMGMPSQISSDVQLPPAVASAAMGYSAFAMVSTPPPRGPDLAMLTPPREALPFLNGIYHVASPSRTQEGKFEHQVFWPVDAEILKKGKNRHYLSQCFDLPHPDNDGNEIMVSYKLLIHPPAPGRKHAAPEPGRKHASTHLRKKGYCFEAAKGEGITELKCNGPKCNGPFEAPLIMTFSFRVCSYEGDKVQEAKGPVTHDFNNQSTARLPESSDGQDIWNFQWSVDELSQKFVVILQADGLISSSGCSRLLS